jgi:uncharacterized Fe-S radical SAM superfamily protein PflX
MVKELKSLSNLTDLFARADYALARAKEAESRAIAANKRALAVLEDIQKSNRKCKCCGKQCNNNRDVIVDFTRLFI